MKIYKLFHKVDGYKAINTKGTKLEESFIEYGNDIDFSKHEGDSFDWYSESTDKDCEFPFINGSTPVFSEEVFNVIAPLISQHSKITNIKAGSKVRLVNRTKDSNGAVWYYVKYGTKYGYIKFNVIDYVYFHFVYCSFV